MLVEYGREALPGFLEGVDAIAAGPPLRASPPHDESSEQQISGADFKRHGIFAVALRQLDGVGKIGDYMSASHAAASGHAGIVSRGHWTHLLACLPILVDGILHLGKQRK